VHRYLHSAQEPVLFQSRKAVALAQLLSVVADVRVCACVVTDRRDIQGANVGSCAAILQLVHRNGIDEATISPCT